MVQWHATNAAFNIQTSFDRNFSGTFGFSIELILTFSFTCKFHILHPYFVFFEFRS